MKENEKLFQILVGDLQKWLTWAHQASTFESRAVDECSGCGK